MANLPPVVQEFRADTSHLRKAAEIIAKHYAAMACELAELDGDNVSAFGSLAPILPVPIDDPPDGARPEPRKWEYPIGWNAGDDRA